MFRPYGAPGGLKDEFEQLAAEHPDITKLVTIGQTVQGEDIVALKVSRDAGRLRDGRRPATLYLGAQHGREWITPEMVRRLAHHVVDGYSIDPAITELVDTTELWFVPVANPDGYDFTFTPGNRLWRKNLRDNDGDGRITANDGVDLNRNFPTKWGYDDEGSSPEAGSETYRGSGPASEPETRAVDRLMARVGFEFLVNYHAASEEVLYGTSWQVATPTPDDALYETLVGDAAAPAVPGYDQGLTADLYTANGITDEHAHTGLRHARVDRRDEHLPDGRRDRPRRRVGSRRVPQHPRVPRRRGAGGGRVPQEPAVRPRPSPSRPPTQPTR